MKDKIALASGLIVIAAIVAAVLILFPQQAAAVSGKQLVALQLTDPPRVPNGTQALLVTYSSARLHEINSNGTSAWITSDASGSLNLTSLINVTQTIATLQVDANAIINQAQFNITSASIVINGTTYPVVLASRTVMANVSSSASVNSTSGILVDFTPTVVTIYTSNSTVFVMVPSVKAVFVGNVPQVNLRVGARGDLGLEDKGHLVHITPNITITSATLITGSGAAAANSQSSANSTYLSVTVLDNSNQSVDLQHVMLFGNQSVFVNVNSTGNVTPDVRMPSSLGIRSGGLKALISLNGTINASEHNGGMGMSLGSEGGIAIVDHGRITSILNRNYSSTLNVSAGLGPAMSDEVHSEIAQAVVIARFRTLNFLVLSNGTLALPFYNSDMEGQVRCAHVDTAQAGGGTGNASVGANAAAAIYCPQFNYSEGYELSPHQSVTLVFNGRISFGGICAEPNVAVNASHAILSLPCPLRIAVTPGSTYRVVVGDEKGAYASANVTARAAS